MPQLRLDAVAIASSNLNRTADFYRLLGFTFPEITDETQHLEPDTKAGEVRLMIDRFDLMQSIIGEVPHPPNHSSFAMLCASPAEVDASAAAVKAAGFTVAADPWDAFWGQRYAVVVDPDGYKVDLFAEL